MCAPPLILSELRFYAWRWPVMANASPARALARECAYGLIAGVVFGALLLVFNIADLWVLTERSPLTIALVIASAAIAFEPVVFCACIGFWRQGVQNAPSSRDD